MNLNIEIRGEGQALVFFHGWGFDHTIWLTLTAILEKKYRLYLVDLPGFGRSSSMSWSQFKSYLLRHLPDDFVLVGWSMGGLYASRLAIEIPERIIHLINIASSPRFIKEDHWPGIDKSIFDGFFKNLTADPQQTISEFIGLQLKDQTYQYSHQFLPNTDSLKDGLTVLADWDLRQALSDFKKPASFLFGRLDAITPRTTMPVMQKLYPSFKYVMFSKAAHMPFLSHQDEFITTLETILT